MNRAHAMLFSVFNLKTDRNEVLPGEPGVEEAAVDVVAGLSVLLQVLDADDEAASSEDVEQSWLFLLVILWPQLLDLFVMLKFDVFFRMNEMIFFHGGPVSDFFLFFFKSGSLNICLFL